MACHRWRVTRTGKADRSGRWRNTRPEALDADVRAGVAERYQDGSYSLDALTSIEEDALPPLKSRGRA